jgi:small-conductance mechanosensitive channel
MRRLISMLFLLVTVFAGIPATSAEESGGAASTAGPTEAGAPVYSRAAVILDGNELFHVFGIQNYPAEERARAIGDRIRAIAADASIRVDTLRSVEQADRTDILAGERPIMSILNTEAEIEGVPHQVLAEIARTSIVQAIETFRQDRSPRVLLVNTAYALGATLVFALTVFGLRRGFRRLEAFVETHFRHRIEGLQAQSHQIIQAERVWKSIQGLLRGAHIAAVFFSAYLYFNLVLGLYPWTRHFSGKLLEIIIDPLRIIGVGLLSSIPDLVFIAILVIVVRYLLRLIRLYFTGIQHETIKLTNFEPEWAQPTYKIVRLFVIIITVVVAYPHIPGSGSEAFKGVSLLMGLVISLGSTSFIANLIAGYTVIYRRAFRVGDRIKVDEQAGDVTEIRLMVTHLRTIKNEEITIPNSLIMNSQVVNYSKLARTHGLILHTNVGIGYETPWRQVEAMLLQAATRTPGLHREPSPFVLQKVLGDFAVTYELNVYCDDAHAMAQRYAALHQNILDVFNEYGVQIMTPAYENDPAQRKLVPAGQWFPAPAAPEPAPGSAHRTP